MYKIEWDRETGGVILSSRVTKETLGISPRPVFHEEFDLIGLDKLGWTYPHLHRHGLRRLTIRTSLGWKTKKEKIATLPILPT